MSRAFPSRGHTLHPKHGVFSTTLSYGAPEPRTQHEVLRIQREELL
jgi:hypothetical protein